MAKRKTEVAYANTDILMCRVYGHAWETQVTFVSKEGRTKVYDSTIICPRCNSTRQDITGASKGALVSRIYSHGEGYVMALDGRTRLQFNREVKLELLERLAKPVKLKAVR